MWSFYSTFCRVLARLCLALLLPPTKDGRGRCISWPCHIVSRSDGASLVCCGSTWPLSLIVTHTFAHLGRPRPPRSSWQPAWNRRPRGPSRPQRLTYILSALSVRSSVSTQSGDGYKSARSSSPDCIPKPFYHILHASRPHPERLPLQPHLKLRVLPALPWLIIHLNLTAPI